MSLSLAWRIVAVLFGSALLAAMFGCAPSPPPEPAGLYDLKIMDWNIRTCRELGGMWNFPLNKCEGAKWPD